MDLDLDLAVKNTTENPVFYVQYAYARICSILRNLQEDGVQKRDCTAEELCVLNAPEERELIIHISALTDEIIQSAKSYDPAHLTHYVNELATKFHKFYAACRVKGDDEVLTQARLNLCYATGIVIKNVLDMMKISAPEKM